MRLLYALLGAAKARHCDFDAWSLSKGSWRLWLTVSIHNYLTRLAKDGKGQAKSPGKTLLMLQKTISPWHRTCAPAENLG